MVHQTVRTEENNWFTLEQVNQATYEMKSPKSAFNFNTNKRENWTSPLLKKLEQFKDSSPEVLFAAFKWLAKNGTMNKTKNNSAIDPNQKEDSDKKNDGAQELPVDMQVDIKELDESLATTKKVLEGNAIKLEEGDAEKKRKRQEKLKLKNKGLKLNIPSQNKFLAESANQKAENKSPQRKIYTPTPTRKVPIINPNDSGCEPFMFINQLSNKGIGKCNFESPFMFAEDINVTSLHCFDMKLCSPGRMMSPSIAGNQDYFKYHLQLSGSLLIHENRDNLLINISPRYVPKSMNKVS